MMTTKRDSIFITQWLVALLFLVMSVGVLYVFVTAAQPTERQPATKFAQGYSEAPLAAALSEARVQDYLRLFEQAGTPQPGDDYYAVGRATGTPGFYRAEGIIRNAFTRAGLEVAVQEFQVVVPRTVECSIVDEYGRALPGVRLYPFEPAGMVPTALPTSGVTAPAVVVESTQALDLVGQPIEGDVKNADEGKRGSIVICKGLTDCSWPTVASLGAKALIVTRDSGDIQADPDTPAPWVQQVTALDVQFPRFYADGPIDQYNGRKLTIRSKVVWQSVPARNLIGVLRGEPGAKEALVVSSYYDSNSLVPDLAPGAEQAVSPAAMLTMLDGLKAYRGQMKRDIIFVATAGHGQTLEGVTRLVGAIETFSQDFSSYTSIDAKLQGHQQKLAYAEHALDIVQSDAPWAPTGADGYRKQWLKEDAKFRTWFEQGITTVAGEINLARREEYLQARLAWIRAGRPTFRDGFDLAHATDAERKNPQNNHPLMAAYIAAKETDTRSAEMLSMPFWELAARSHAIKTDDFTAWNYRGTVREYFTDLASYHHRQLLELESDRNVKKIFSQYKTTCTVNLELYSAGHATADLARGLAVMVGRPGFGSSVEPQCTELRTAIEAKVPLTADGLKRSFDVKNWGPIDTSGSGAIATASDTVVESILWFKAARLAYSVCNLGVVPAKMGTPEDTFAGMSPTIVTQQIQPLGKALLSIGNGRVTFKNLAYSPGYGPFRTCSGTVYTSAGNASLVPNHPMGRNTFVHIYSGPPDQRAGSFGIKDKTLLRGVRVYPIVQANPYGEYFRDYVVDLVAATVDAVRFDEGGRVSYYKDMGAVGQSVFRNETVLGNEITLGNAKPINVALFRCTTVNCFQRGNPQTMNVFGAFDFLNSQGMTALDKFHFEASALAPGICAYLAPDANFVIAMKSGSAENPDVQTYRAFMLNVDTANPIAGIRKDEPDIYGRGYLAADTPNITFPYFDAAASMLRTNEKRLRLQKQFHMADAQMLDSQTNALGLLRLANTFRHQGDALQASNTAGRSLAMAMNNHPVIRSKISNAVYGIIWYLVLLVPFAFFFEKLVFGFADIRKQLVAHGLIIVGVFVLLRMFHPAFHMVSNPFVILLGFLIFLLAMIVSMMVMAKFQQNIADLRKREGAVEGADINRGGVVGTAFMLGLNNMRRRKVRTGLTCVTLVLITFVMICFTSVSTGLQSVEYATGRYPANGFMLRDQNFQTLADNQLSNINQVYGLQFPVSVHQWVTQIPNPGALSNLVLNVDRSYQIGARQIQRRKIVGAAVAMPWNEPQFSGIDRYLLTSRGWFPKPAQMKTVAELADDAQKGIVPKKYVILPDTVAKELGFTVDDVNTGHHVVTINGTQEFEVLGIIDTEKLSNLAGMDGQSILPYDLGSGVKLSRPPDGTERFLVPANAPRLKGDQVVITSEPVTGIGQIIKASCSVMFPKAAYQLRSDLPSNEPLSYKQQRQVIDEYLEQVGQAAYYTVDGISYFGKRTRAKTVEGLIALLIPILIAAMTVFNTMRGSVYERRDEIFVYNAVGIAPNHVFFMFMAEACVYAVIGAVMGYIVSQVTGTVLTNMNLTGGLNMDYSSIETVYASLAIVVSVLLSTLVPARAAARLASPSEEASWAVPTAENDVMRFNLPFTFTAHDRIAIISYFQRWLDANGEGSSGGFFCSPPLIRVSQRDDEPNSAGLVPEIETTIWLKPYDLGVSQRLTIALPTDPETGEYIASITIERLSGTMAAWNRTIMPFLTALRKQFLNWRAVSDTERAEMFTESKQLMMNTITDEEVATHV